jgi:hypothetical protein
MASYQILWVDDDWSDTKTTDQLELDKRNFLLSSLKKIEYRLKEIDNHPNWKFCHTVDKAVIEIHQTANDFRIAIVDFKYKPDDHQFGEILDHIRRRNIPYIVYSYFPRDVEKYPDFKGEDELRIGVIPKSTDAGGVLAERVAAFFKAPPFRILHLSDLHYDSNAKGAKSEEQKDLFDSLLSTLKEEHENNKFDAITITGDFSSENPEGDLDKVSEFINNLVNKTMEFDNIGRLFLVPGNHDLYWKDFEKGIISETPWKTIPRFLPIGLCFPGQYPGSFKCMESKKPFF